MTVYAYVRVSDIKKQDSSNQRKVINDYATTNNLVITHWKEFHISGSKTNKSQRGIDELITNLKPNDIVIVSDIARLGRDDMHTVINIITSITGKDASLHLAYSKQAITPLDKNDIGKMFMMIGEAYASVKFSEERSIKAKIAHSKKKELGLPTGRTVGSKNKDYRLTPYIEFILRELKKGTAKTKIIKMLNDKGVQISRSGFYKYLDNNLSI